MADKAAVTANVTQPDKEDLAVLAFLNGRSVRDEAGQAILQRLVFFREQINAVPKKQRELILKTVRK